MTQFARLTTAHLSDAIDALGSGDACLILSGLIALHPDRMLIGRIYPMRVQPDMTGRNRSEGLVAAVEAIPAGSVVFIEAEDVEFAVWGDLAASAASARGAAGVVCNGLVRDVESLYAGSTPVFAMGATPRRALGRADVVEHGRSIRVHGVLVDADDFVMADQNGVVIVPHGLAESVLERASEVAAREAGVRLRLARGEQLGSALRAGAP